MKPLDPSDVRRHNLSLVLREVAERGPRSRATLALETGLNKSTVSSLVSELAELGLVRESGEEERPGAVGRPQLGGEAAVRGAVALSRQRALEDPAALDRGSLFAGVPA
jgi:DNA-binding IclR family transcriptional regulator